MIHTQTNHLWDLHKEVRHYNITHHLYTQTGFPGTPPTTNMIPATISSRPKTSLYVRFTYTPPPPPTTTACVVSTFQEYVLALPLHLQQLLQHITLPDDNGYSLIQSCYSNEGLAACDGSVLQGSGSFGFLLTNKSQTSCIKGYGKVPNTYSPPPQHFNVPSSMVVLR